MNINNLKQIFDNIATNNGIKIEYILMPCQNIKFYGYFNIPNKITLNTFFPKNIQVETEAHEIVHYFDVYYTETLQREILADYITIQIFNHFDIPLVTYTMEQIKSITESFKTVIDYNIFNSIFSMIFFEIQSALKNLKNDF